MTHISDEEAREVLWASGEEGKAQLRAAWDEAQRLGLHRFLSMADVGALLWAARNARLPEDP